MSKALVLGVIALIVGCVTVTESVKEERVMNRAKWDLDCKGGKVSLHKIDATSYGAVGCGKEAVYTLDKCHPMNWASVCQAILNGSVRPSKK